MDKTAESLFQNRLEGMLSHGAMDFSDFIKKEAGAEIVETEEVVEEPVEEVAAEEVAEAPVAEEVAEVVEVEKTAAPEPAQSGQDDLMKIASMAILENAPAGGLELLAGVMLKVANTADAVQGAGHAIGGLAGRKGELAGGAASSGAATLGAIKRGDVSGAASHGVRAAQDVSRLARKISGHGTFGSDRRRLLGLMGEKRGIGKHLAAAAGSLAMRPVRAVQNIRREARMRDMRANTDAIGGMAGKFAG